MTFTCFGRLKERRLAAFFSGHYSVMLFINRAGEAHFEIVLISVLIAVIALAFILYVRDLWKEK
jgi:hypothetical protein